jgi:hypothetical protein
VFKITPRHGSRRTKSSSLGVQVCLPRGFITTVSARTTENAVLLVLCALPSNSSCLPLSNGSTHHSTILLFLLPLPQRANIRTVFNKKFGCLVVRLTVGSLSKFKYGFSFSVIFSVQLISDGVAYESFYTPAVLSCHLIL